MQKFTALCRLGHGEQHWGEPEMRALGALPFVQILLPPPPANILLLLRLAAAILGKSKRDQVSKTATALSVQQILMLLTSAPA